MRSIRLFVGNIPHALDEAGLAQAFEEVGVSVTNPKILRDRETGNPRGFGFVDIAEGSRVPQSGEINVMGRGLRIEMAQKQNQDRRTPSGPRRSERSFGEQPAMAMAPESAERRGRGRKPDRPGRGRSRRDRGDFGRDW